MPRLRRNSREYSSRVGRKIESFWKGGEVRGEEGGPGARGGEK